jgi:hypothetical protein
MTRYFASIGDHILRFDTDALWAGMWLVLHLQAVESGKLRSPRLIDLQADLTVEIGTGDADRPGGGVAWASNGRHARIVAADESALERAVTQAYGSYVVRCEWGLLLHAEPLWMSAVCALSAGESDGLALVRIRGGEPLVYDPPFGGGLRTDAARRPLPLSAVHWLCRPGQTDIGLAAPAEAAARLRRIAVAADRGGTAPMKLAWLCRKLAERVPMYEPSPAPPQGCGLKDSIR